MHRMNRLAVVASLLPVLSLSLPSSASANVQFQSPGASAYTDSGSTGSLQSTTGLSVSAGNFLIVAVRWYQSSGQTVSGVTDGAGNTFHSIAQRCDSQTAITCLQLWYAYDTLAASNDVATVTFTANAAWAYMSVHQYSGVLSSSNPIDVAGGHGADGNGTTLTSSGFTASYGGELVFCGGTAAATSVSWAVLWIQPS